ncbi:hypothetical protein [Tardiphaga sp. vice304]|uniref:hypothetical protein n=1 Tax=Tardiphaga sp. vice304 TaxID=2592817 RepID=UPI00143E01AA|nr:hypothetical protein [Tardiphaga sp. vice304]
MTILIFSIREITGSQRSADTVLKRADASDFTGDDDRGQPWVTKNTFVVDA